MSRAILVSVPSAMPTASPPLGALYLGAALLRAGHDVRLLDLASPSAPPAVEAVARALDEGGPAVLGVTLYAETALATYRLLGEIGLRPGVLRVAGGPHATAVPEEALEHGFDVVVRGEGEDTLVELLATMERGASLADVPGLVYRHGSGACATAPRAPRSNLDELASPVTLAGAATVPALITSRGCPGRCTFCSSFVTGRRYRFHSVGRVLEEMRALHSRSGSASFFFHDDAFTAHRARLLELCASMGELPFSPQWVCEARVDHLDSERAQAMARAGCTTVIVGVESGDPGVLARIGKGITLDQVERALRDIKDAGMGAHANFMFGFPDETEAELERTLAFMQRIAPLADGLGVMGIVTPYPGTALYEQHREACGFARWWLDEARMREWHAATISAFRTEVRSIEDVALVQRRMEEAVLDARLIRYARPVRTAIDRCLEFRRQHSVARLRRLNLT